ncbi:homoprotocatechuate degradation operon regulator HpaR, partial [Salmonella enterica]|nr:homoprotocatechuate degradation operon regulator HpaR [Salmonella enterica]EGS9490070.1 homoprotocatechuate degradation operon regulator HpaR [Salmonella enterica]EGS9573106.1 homoprotocatechuate degradation operon regulator HpaR [Salmonella enterica]
GQTLYARARSQVEEAYRKIEADFTPEKTQQLMLLLDDLIALGRQHPDSEAEA